MRIFIRRIPWFYILFSVYPLLFLWTVNAPEIRASAVVRPFLFTLAGSAVLFAILWFSFRDIKKAALLGALLLLAFFSYGHVYYESRIVPALGVLSHHSTLIPIYVVLFGLGVWGLFFHIKKYENLIQFLNMASLVLVILQVFQLGYYYTRASYAALHPVTLQSGLTVTIDREDLPDIYFIVLDGYTRADALQQDMGFDNEQFVNELESLGFYVAKCSRPNSDYTRGSISSTLNMDYLPELEKMSRMDVDDPGFPTLIKHSQVRQLLESVGYKMVTFPVDYPWLQIDDSAIFLTPNQPTVNPNYLYPFERIYVQRTAAAIFTAANSKLNILSHFRLDSSPEEITPGISLSLDPVLLNHVDTVLFILQKLPDVVTIPGPKFIYAHILDPHFPHVFSPDGSILTDPGFYGGENFDAVNDEYRQQGYLDSLQFINKQIIPILQTIIEKSPVHPIIILEGDHGFKGDNRYTNLNAYYLPKGYASLYPSISPVNSFRVVFNDYFGANYPLLPDITEDAVNNVYPDCSP